MRDIKPVWMNHCTPTGSLEMFPLKFIKKKNILSFAIVHIFCSQGIVSSNDAWHLIRQRPRTKTVGHENQNNELKDPKMFGTANSVRFNIQRGCENTDLSSIQKTNTSAVLIRTALQQKQTNSVKCRTAPLSDQISCPDWKVKTKERKNKEGDVYLEEKHYFAFEV